MKSVVGVIYCTQSIRKITGNVPNFRATLHRDMTSIFFGYNCTLGVGLNRRLSGHSRRESDGSSFL